jgi:hypothetical protein
MAGPSARSKEGELLVVRVADAVDLARHLNRRSALKERLVGDVVRPFPGGPDFQAVGLEGEGRAVSDLDRTRRQLAARRVRIPAAADVEERRLRDLSGDIKLKPGELRIEFFGAEDLAAKLLELSKAMSNDWPAFARAVEDKALPASAANSEG